MGDGCDTLYLFLFLVLHATHNGGNFHTGLTVFGDVENAHGHERIVPYRCRRGGKGIDAVVIILFFFFFFDAQTGAGAASETHLAAVTVIERHRTKQRWWRWGRRR